MKVPRLRSCLGVIPLRTGAILIALFAVINKLSGFFGVFAWDYTDPVAVAGYFYSIISTVILSYGLVGLIKDSLPKVRILVYFYWIDVLIGTLNTILLTIIWFIYTEHHTIPDPSYSEDEAEDREENFDKVWAMEEGVTIAILAMLWVLHLYFGLVLLAYYQVKERRPHGMIPLSSTAEFELDPECSENEADFALDDQPLPKSA
ncbi:hypothetical protein BZG36_02838 [Bifiguratus adelaidae]|uniref:Uncharacterized protein n=1 Tax=Bifiguratus adelaidae TaxID=1938954 RepID=A0A261Y0J0_9FUNG|nr:hypothetical protein BZG36_02838 [Bifiguratus adelaidae]